MKPEETTNNTAGAVCKPTIKTLSPLSLTSPISHHHSCTPKPTKHHTMPNKTTCTNNGEKWIELIARLGSFSRLQEILTEGLEKISRRTGLKEARLVLLYNRQLFTLAENRAADFPPLNYRDLLEDNCPEPVLCCPVLQNREFTCFFVAKGREKISPGFFCQPAFTFWICAIEAYSAYLLYDLPSTAGENIHFSSKQKELTKQFPAITTQNDKMAEVLSLINKIADSDLPVLIQGESGTGKELIARAIHDKSKRRSNQYIVENCAAVPENLLESEFFGVTRGAYTGATKNREGLFSLARNGTLFLDEIGEMSLSIQKKLLRVLQEKSFRKVGSSRTETTNARIIAATNISLKKNVFLGSFRKDLFFRLNTITITLPPLKERKDDIPLLAECFLKEFIKEHTMEPGGLHLSEATIDALVKYQWPGNIRELKNEIMRSAVLTRKGIIHPSQLSQHILSGSRNQLCPDPRQFLSGNTSLPEFEKNTIGAVIKNLLDYFDKNKTECAKALGISKTSLYRRMRKYDIM